MNHTKLLGFQVTCLMSYLEEKGILKREEFSRFCLATLEDDRLAMNDAEKAEMKKALEVLLPLRLVD